jgi:Xaa-Pro aminopeptidase
MSTVAAPFGRLTKFSAILAEKGIDAYFCTSAVTMGYLAGFHEEGGERLLFLAVGKGGQVRLVAPALARTQAERSGIADIRTWRDGDDPMDLARGLGSDWGLSTVAVDDEMRSAILLALQSSLPSVRFVAGQPILSELVRKKDARELDLLREAGRIADEALAPVVAQIKPGMTEWQVHELLTAEMLRGGGKPNFCIVGAGSHGAEPHHMTGQTPLQEGDVVVMDYGCVVDGYMSDITRTVCLGEPTEEQRRVYETVYASHMAGRSAIAPGVPAEDVDRAARRMRIHEEPYICAGNRHRLEVGNVFSIEPGIYLPGKFGVRIENIVTVTENGHASLNADASPTLLSMPVSER